MSELEAVYNCIEEKKLEVVDDFENSDFLVVKWLNDQGNVLISVSTDYPEAKLDIKSEFESLDNKYVEKMLALHAESVPTRLQLHSTIQELEDKLLPELLEEKEAIETGKKLRAEKLAKSEENDEIPYTQIEPKQKSRMTKQKENKNPKMKTVMDVVNRIRWDEKLDTSKFTVGYTDRFVGVLEKPFDDFTWNNIVDVDYYEDFGVPEHRVVYFKYLDEKVWDRETRVDHIFGSGQGKGITIYDLLEQMKNL